MLEVSLLQTEWKGRQASTELCDPSSPLRGYSGLFWSGLWPKRDWAVFVPLPLSFFRSPFSLGVISFYYPSPIIFLIRLETSTTLITDLWTPISGVVTTHSSPVFCRKRSFKEFAPCVSRPCLLSCSTGAQLLPLCKPLLVQRPKLAGC